MAVAMRARVRELADGWIGQGHDLGFAVGIAQGFATLGRIGFEGRFDYAAIGSVTNLAARLCAEAQPWQVLRHPAGPGGAEDVAVSEPVGDLDLRGFSRPVRAFARARAGRRASRAMTASTVRAGTHRGRRSSDLDEDERYQRFDRLQAGHARRLGRDAAQPGGRVRGGHAVGDVDRVGSAAAR